MTGRHIIRALLWTGVLGTWGGRLDAQGVTGAAVQGTVVGVDSQPLAGATVQVNNPGTGERWQSETLTDGRFYLDHLSVGGPYTLVVRAIGYTPATQDGINLSLGQRLSVDVVLVHAAYHLADLEVTTVPDPRINKGRTGPALTISDSVIERQPVFGRDFTNLALLSPQVSPGPNGISFAGAHDRLNSVQVDGATVNDLKGGFGREGGLIALPLEALQEVKVLTAPFDVRFGNFAGGLIQSASKSGSNRVQASVYGHFEGQDLNGANPDGTRGGQNTQNEFGLTVGGPIVRDKVAGFISANSVYELFFPVGTPGRDTTGGADSAGVGVRYATMVRFQDILRNTYGVDPGEIATGDFGTSTRSFFAKVTAQLGLNSRLEVSHNYLYNNSEPPYTLCCFNAGLTSNAEEDPVHDHTTQLSWTAAFGRQWSNELVLARTTRRHRCIVKSDFPTVQVEADDGVIVAGMQEVCRGQDNGQSRLALTDNLGWTMGSHRFTFGTHNELIRLYDDDLGVLSTTGQWYFGSLDDLEQGTPLGYTRPVPGPDLPASSRPDFKTWQLAFYAQDQWTPTSQLTLTAGVRLDVPLLPTAPTQNPQVLQAFGVNTARTPSGHFMWSPRLGINYDLTGRQRSIIRGGIGLFQGPPAFGWLEEAYRGTGLQSLFLECFGEFTPAFTLEFPQPDQCGDGTLPTPIITAFDPAFRYPQNLKIVLGGDQRLPWNIVGTVDLAYIRGIHQFALRDLNLLPPTGFAAGEGGRALYGTIDESGMVTPDRRHQSFDEVIQITNASGDRAYTLALQLQKRFANGNEVGIAYTYMDAKSREDSPRGDSFGNLAQTVVDPTRENPGLRTSLNEVPHQIRFMAALDLPLKVRLGLFFLGFSGSPFTYAVQGDVNGDGIGADFSRVNDAVYVPTDASDILLVNPEDGSPASAAEYAGLDEFIESQPCLRAQRGRVLQRNSCRQLWTSELDARLTKAITFARGHSLEVSADLFNVLNFLDRDWGRKYLIADGGNFFGAIALLRLHGYDSASGRGIYEFMPPDRRQFDVEGTRWQLRLSGRYTFH